MEFDYTIIISVASITMLWLVGSKKWYAWVFGLFSQGLWFYFVIDKGVWGLLPMHIVYTLLYVRNLFKWRNEDKIVTIKLERKLRDKECSSCGTEMRTEQDNGVFSLRCPTCNHSVPFSLSN